MDSTAGAPQEQASLGAGSRLGGDGTRKPAGGLRPSGATPDVHKCQRLNLPSPPLTGHRPTSTTHLSLPPSHHPPHGQGSWKRSPGTCGLRGLNFIHSSTLCSLDSDHRENDTWQRGHLPPLSAEIWLTLVLQSIPTNYVAPTGLFPLVSTWSHCALTPAGHPLVYLFQVPHTAVYSCASTCTGTSRPDLSWSFLAEPCHPHPGFLLQTWSHRPMALIT